MFDHIKVLIVDDEISIRKLLEFYLKKHFTVIAKKNGKEAKDWIEEGNLPTVIVADLNMPEMDGYALMDYVRGNSKYDGIPLMILSANESSSDRIRCFKAGADDYVIKPFNPEELYYRIFNKMKRINNI
ncbi:Response regulator receiver domain-containing protein [Cyclonatronum proteinivorum]|uniref:Response regulator receiver domain-containing protein n=1 Tax=Cyclonatronum proteinivorum TaxID=1457365 RepID=A0A345UIK1_9BACT|nr:response regulator transcription factor [Cyclonatronum proteinivorum]AXJ00303.1 Response regulator receiver domain-containing protein [Cyclonatronum proteinivorum]